MIAGLERDIGCRTTQTHATRAGLGDRCGLGMQTVDSALRGLLARHLITPEEAMQHAVQRDQVLARATAGAGVPGR